MYGTEASHAALQMSLGLSSCSIHPTCTSSTDIGSNCRYVVLNRNGTLNELEAASRRFNPLSILHEMKSAVYQLQRLQPLLIRLNRTQNNLVHLPTQIRVSHHRQPLIFLN